MLSIVHVMCMTSFFVRKISSLVIIVAPRSKNGALDVLAIFLQRAAQGEDPHTFLALGRKRVVLLLHLTGGR